MKWIIIAILAGICVPSVYKCFWMLTRLSTLVPEYLRWVTADSTALKDIDTRKRWQNLWTEIFTLLQTYLLNVIVLVLLGWYVWHWQIPDLSTWLRYVISVVSIIAGVGNFMAARHVTREYMHVRATGRVWAEVRLHMKHPKNLPKTSLTTGDTLVVRGGISMYLLSVVAAGSLIYVVWL